MSSITGWKRLNAAWLAAAALLLAACGGGGGSGNIGVGSGLGDGGGAATSPLASAEVQKAASPQAEEELPLSEHADGTGPAARFVEPGAMAIDRFGNQFVIDRMPDQDTVIRKITPEGVVSTLTTTASGGPDNLLRWSGAPLGGIAVDAQGTLYVSNYWNAVIEKIDAAGVVSVLAGKRGEQGLRDGIGDEVRLDMPMAIAAAADGTVYFVEYYQNKVRKIAPDGAVGTIAGGGGWGPGDNGGDGVGADARFNYPSALAVDGQKNLYVFDDRRVRKITAQGSVTTLAGSNNALRPYYVDGEGAAAGFGYQPGALSVDSSGALYLADTGNNVIRKVQPDGTVSTFAGAQYPSVVLDSDGYNTPAAPLYQDGGAQVARFGNLRGLAISTQGIVYAVDAGNFLIRKVEAGNVSTLAGRRSRPSLSMNP